MSWFREREGEKEKPEVKPKNQILQMSEKETPESKEKLFRQSLKVDKPNAASGGEVSPASKKDDAPWKEERIRERER